MANKIELADELLSSVSGGQITYTWDGGSGSIGIGGYNPFKLVNKDEFVEYYNSVKGTMSDAQILTHLIETGAVLVP